MLGLLWFVVGVWAVVVARARPVVVAVVIDSRVVVVARVQAVVVVVRASENGRLLPSREQWFSS